MGSAGLYIHIPFCESKCGYCDFFSRSGCEALMEPYLDAVLCEAARYGGMAVDTVFLGGGTPSALIEGSISRLLRALGNALDLRGVEECTIEVNPNSFTAAKAAEYAAAGINRISIGAQAAQDRLLAAIGRRHTFGDAEQAVQTARRAGIENISMDMLYSLPEQTVADVRETAARIVALGVAHVSAYALKLERGVPLYGAPQPSEEEDREMFWAAMEVFRSAGLERYEISNFARPGRECRHNLKYWRCEDYIGLGASAHSCLRGERFSNRDQGYIQDIRRKGNAEAGRERIRDPLAERVMLETRLCAGLSLDALPKSGKVQAFLELLERQGLARAGETLSLTDRGMDVQSSIVVGLWEAMGAPC